MRAFSLFLALATMACAQDLPEKQPGDRLEFEPELMLQDLPEAKAAEGLVASSPVSSAEVERARLAVERAKRKAIRWQQLQKKGVLSRVEAEAAALQVTVAVQKYTALRAAEARVLLEEARRKQAAGESVDELKAAETAVAEATDAAAHAHAELVHARSEAAATNLSRQRRLYAAGLISKAQLKRAEAKESAPAMKSP